MSDYEDDFEVTPEKKHTTTANGQVASNNPVDSISANKSPTAADVNVAPPQKSASSQDLTGKPIDGDNKRLSYAESDRPRQTSIGMNNSSADKGSVTENPSWLSPTEKRRNLSTSASPEPPQALETKAKTPPKADARSHSSSRRSSSYASRSSSRRSSSSSRAPSSKRSSPARSPRKEPTVEATSAVTKSPPPPKAQSPPESPPKTPPVKSPIVSARGGSSTEVEKKSPVATKSPTPPPQQRSRSSSRASSRPISSRSGSRASSIPTPKSEAKPAPVSPPFIAHEPPPSSSHAPASDYKPQSRTPSANVNTRKPAHGAALLAPPPRAQQQPVVPPRVAGVSPARSKVIPPPAAVTRRDLATLGQKNIDLNRAIDDITQQLSLMAPGIIKLRKANSAGDSDRLTKLRNDIATLELENEALQKKLRNADSSGSIERLIAAREAEIKELQQRNRWLEGEIRRNGKRLKDGDKLTFQQQKATLAEELRKDKAVAQVSLDKTTRDAEQAVSGREQAEAAVAALLDKDTFPELRINDVRTVVDLRLRIAEKIESIKTLKVRQTHAANVAAQTMVVDDAARTASSNLDADLEAMRKQVEALREVVNEGMIKRGGASPTKHGRRSHSNSGMEEIPTRKAPIGAARRRLTGEIAANRSPSKPPVAASTPVAEAVATPNSESKPQPVAKTEGWLNDDDEPLAKKQETPRSGRLPAEKKAISPRKVESTKPSPSPSSVPINKDPAWLALDDPSSTKAKGATKKVASKPASRSPTPPPDAPKDGQAPRRASWLDDEKEAEGAQVMNNEAASHTTPPDSQRERRNSADRQREESEKEEERRRVAEETEVAKLRAEEEAEQRRRDAEELARLRQREADEKKREAEAEERRQAEEKKRREEEETREREAEEERKRKAASAPPPSWETPDWMKEAEPVKVSPPPKVATPPPSPPPAPAAAAPKKVEEDEEPDWLKD